MGAMWRKSDHVDTMCSGILDCSQSFVAVVAIQHDHVSIGCGGVCELHKMLQPVDEDLRIRPPTGIGKTNRCVYYVFVVSCAYFQLRSSTYHNFIDTNVSATINIKTERNIQSQFSPSPFDMRTPALE